ncbi:hypothetical protein PRZ48_008367 [Zasmidium cellare]|uniref:Uncharacterized protein n=1 Tax=Zasmidium cellare TaxID=395010 RepID=A0ABR0EG17_ZASCE|nr:hypothetical protein PRZ48_008367 [Zasmidium cellare]
MATSSNQEPPAEHWLMETPDIFLAQRSSTPERQGFPPYTTLTLRIFLFNRDAVLLQRQNGSWTLPVLQCVAGDITTNNKSAILQRIVFHLSQSGIPPLVLLHLQFMDFIRDEVPLTTQTDQPDELVISTILTTRHWALEKEIAPSDMRTTPESTPLRWTKILNIFEISLVGCTAGAINHAYGGLNAVKSKSFLARMSGDPPITRNICFRMIQGIILTRRIVDPTFAECPALIGVSKASNNRFLGIMLVGWDNEYWRAQIGERYMNGHDELYIVGKWWNGVFYGMDEFFEWWKLFCPMGRLRIGTGAGEVLD